MMTNFTRVLAIALNTFKEAVRNRILYVLLFFAVLILLGAWVASTLAISGQDKIVRDLGVASINIISVLIAVMVGVGIVYNELDKKTIYTIVSKPIARWHYLVGKYLGLLLTLYVNIILMTWFFLVVLYLRHFLDTEVMNKALFVAADGTLRDNVGSMSVGVYYIGSLLTSIGQATLTTLTLGLYHTPTTMGVMTVSMLTMLEMSIITAFAVLFSSFSTPILSAFMTVAAFIMGRANEDLYYFADMMVQRSGGLDKLSAGQTVAYWFSMAACHIAPNLSYFDQRQAVSLMKPPVIELYTLVYGVAYAAVVLTLASMVFDKRNFK